MADIHAQLELGRRKLRHLDIDGAAVAFERALEIDPDNIETLQALAALSAATGNSDRANTLYFRILDISPQHGDAYYGLAMMRGNSDVQALIGGAQAVAASENAGTRDRVLAHFALGHLFEQNDDPESAFAHFEQANSLQRGGRGFDVARQRDAFDAHRRELNEALVDRCRESASDDGSVIFVVGLPRSGTTLVEHILAAHSAVFGAGEVEFARDFTEAVQRLTGKPFPDDIADIAAPALHDLAADYLQNLHRISDGAGRVVDKLPHNFLRIGLFAALLPNSRFVVCERDPVDTCLSIYCHHFADDHGYATDLADLGAYYKLYRGITDHWSAMFPDSVYTVHYEKLVTNTDAEVRGLLNFCGLTFEPACVEGRDPGRFVSTPSASQVRHEIHQRSLASADKYRDHLGPLFDALA